MTAAAIAPAPELSLRSARGRFTLGSIVVAHFAHHVTNSLLTPLLPSIRDTFQLSYAQSGFAVAAFSVTLGLANAPLGMLADRIGSRLVLAGGLVAMGAVSIALGLAGSYEQLLVLLLIMGVISGSYHAPAASLLARTFSSRVRGTAMGVHITGGHLSFFAAPVVAGYLVAATGTWRTPYMWFALAPILLGVVILAVAPRGHERAAPSDRLAPFREIANVGRVIGPLVSLSIIFQIGLAAFYAFLSLYLVDARGMSIALAASLYAFPQLMGVIGAPAGGWLSDRLGRRAVIVTGLAAVGPAIYAVTVLPNELLLIPLAVIGIGSAMRQTVTEVLVMDAAPPERRATVLGAYYLVAAEVGGFAAPAFGILAVAIGIASAFSFAGIALFAVSAFALIVGRRL